MRYTSLILASALAASHVCHGKPLPTPTPDDPPYSEGFPAAEAESVSTTSFGTEETTAFVEETTYPGLYPTNTEDFPSGTFGDVTTTATKGFGDVTVSATATATGGHSSGENSSEEHSGTEEHSSGEHSGSDEEHSGGEEHSAEGHSSEGHSGSDEHSSEGHSGTEEHSGSNEEHSVADEEHKPVETPASGASEEHGAPPNHEAHSGDAESSDDESDSDDEAHSHHDASSEQDTSSNNDHWSQHEAPAAESSPKPDQDRPCGKLDPWTIHSLSRQCDDADLVCGWSFIVDTNCPSLAPTPCTFSIKSLGPGVPASRSPKHEKGQDEQCGPYEVHSAWSGQFGPGQGFTTLSVIDGGNKLVAYPAYRDDLFGKEKATVPDVEVAVYALG
ncbi:hypothetical protein B0T20DRAFT_243083 [Sordaria brevicollis]|uniref:Uncharacterized protein n=1 Tax=Sordaria brevicollis TaxID=83679 RepID=A0AAE0UAE3_SORBR|nr:hypothetical protein B0T20DRAFT_243083 [Sordaria brevicollis]